MKKILCFSLVIISSLFVNLSGVVTIEVVNKEEKIEGVMYPLACYALINHSEMRELQSIQPKQEKSLKLKPGLKMPIIHFVKKLKKPRKSLCFVPGRSNAKAVLGLDPNFPILLVAKRLYKGGQLYLIREFVDFSDFVDLKSNIKFRVPLLGSPEFLMDNMKKEDARQVFDILRLFRDINDFVIGKYIFFVADMSKLNIFNNELLKARKILIGLRDGFKYKDNKPIKHDFNILLNKINDKINFIKKIQPQKVKDFMERLEFLKEQEL